jgi:hypothetical protein
MSLRNQVLRLAQDNPELRPHLLEVVAGSGLVPLLTRVFSPDLLWDGEAKVTSRATKTDTGEVDATSYTDRYDYGRDTHLTDDSGGYVSFRYASEVTCRVEVKVPGLPPNAAKRDVQANVAHLLATHGKEMFQTNIENEGDPWQVLQDSVVVRDGSVSGIRWNVRSVRVLGVDVRIAGTEASVVFQVALSISPDTQDAEARSEPDFDRYASLRSRVIRLAHAHPEFRDVLLPLVK